MKPIKLTIETETNSDSKIIFLRDHLAKGKTCRIESIVIDAKQPTGRGFSANLFLNSKRVFEVVCHEAARVELRPSDCLIDSNDTVRALVTRPNENDMGKKLPKNKKQATVELTFVESE